MSTSQEVPKAILYSWHTSVWSTVPRLCLHEKGYSQDEYVVRDVDITKGENFSPSYLKINMNGTVPTLVVPMLETTGPESDSRYRSLRDTITICDFLDSARGSHTQNTTSERPAPALAPATIEGKSNSDRIISLVHLPTVDPNFLNMAARSQEELKEKAGGRQGAMLKARHDALSHFIKEAKQAVASAPQFDASKGPTYEQRQVQFLEDKLAANKMLLDTYAGSTGAESQKAFFEAATKSWQEGVPEVLGKLEESIKGTYVLGDQVSLGDLHLIAWLSRIIEIAGGDRTAAGLQTLEQSLANFKIGPKLEAFWAAWIERESFKSVYASGLH